MAELVSSLIYLFHRHVPGQRGAVDPMISPSLTRDENENKVFDQTLIFMQNQNIQFFQNFRKIAQRMILNIFLRPHLTIKSHRSAKGGHFRDNGIPQILKFALKSSRSIGKANHRIKFTFPTLLD